MKTEVLRRARKKKFNSAQAFADALGVTRLSVVNWETGKFEPSSDTLRRIADILDVSVEYLLGEEENPHNKPSFRLESFAALLDTVYRETYATSKEEVGVALYLIKEIEKVLLRRLENETDNS